MKKKLKSFLILLLSVTIIGVAGGCSNEEKASGDETKEASADKETKSDAKEEKKANVTEKDVNDFVLEATNIVQVFNISKRVNQQYPDLGPFYVVRGIDERGQKIEIWIKDLKIYEMTKSNSKPEQEDEKTEKE